MSIITTVWKHIHCVHQQDYNVIGTLTRIYLLLRINVCLMHAKAKFKLKVSGPPYFYQKLSGPPK